MSVGYSVESYLREEGEGDALPTLIATRWTPMEISAVLVPADFGAQARAEPEGHHTTIPVTVRRAESAAGKEPSMTTPTTNTLDPVAAERQRAADINLIGTNHRASHGLIKRALEGDMSVPQFREAILDEMRARRDRTQIFSIAPSDYDHRDETPLAERMADALLGRLQPRHKVTTGRDFVGVSLGEMARTALENSGVSTRGMSTGQLIERASMHTTSDLPVMLDTVANRILRDAYNEQPSGLREAAKEQTARDFRTRFSIGLDLAGKLTKVNEAGEFKRLTIKEGAEGYSLSTFGGVFAVSRQALINENLGYFAEMPAHFGKLAARLEAEQLTNLLLGTQKLSDGLAIYHATHGNLLTPAALSTTSSAAARSAMRRQKGAAGEVINISPKYLVVPPELELLGEQVLAEVNAEKIADVNVFAGRLTLIVENNLADPQARYVLADRGASGLEYAYLEGEKGVQLMSRVGFDVDGQEWKARLDFGSGWTDFRGAVKNPGVAP
ncbi:Mu-like prophage major head subunit gpT family protein [Devosia sp. A8/3-2]|nr:Mu-like prophage major head subunit gpT family protein [Devosia sp. A8/3-2]